MGLKERRALSSTHWYSRTVFLNGLRLAWIVLLIWGELGLYFRAVASCQWPDADLKHNGKPTHVLLVSDPQFQDASTLAHSNLRKNWHVATRLNPNAVILLGDMLAHGKYATSASGFHEYAARFKRTFSLDISVPIYSIPGNNDVGMGATSGRNRQYYVQAFGPVNHVIEIQNHSFVFLDAPGLVDEDYQRSAQGVEFAKWAPIPDGPVGFVNSIVPSSTPLILLSHIPLSRPDSAPCGPLREKGAIHRGVGPGYQNTLGKQTTTFLLDALRPSLIFSGDNRDYCEYTHTYATEAGFDNTVKEVTVKSISSSPHIQHPGFHMLSLVDPSAKPSLPSFAEAPCFLPDQNAIYKGLYQPFFVFTMVVLGLFNTLRLRKARQSHLPVIALSSSRGRSGPPSPVGPPDSAIWSPYTPTIPVSPDRSPLPSTIRTPNFQSEPMLRTASRPVTPLMSPLLSPAIYSGGEDEEEEMMYPAQYAFRQSQMDEDSWSEDYHTNGLHAESNSSYFLPVPQQRRSWSWSFVFRGQGRRITFHVPTFSQKGFRDLLGLLEGPDRDATVHRRGLVKSTILDGISVAWVSVLVWLAINCWVI